MQSQHGVVYHVYALGACGAPARNDRRSQPVPRLDRLLGEIPRIRALGTTTLLLGPVFQAQSHGYDTIDYLQVDRRLGTDATLVNLALALADHGIDLMLDAVLNHVGRDFFAFADLRAKGARSAFTDWFHVDFTRDNRLHDGFRYSGWGNSTALVNLNLDNPEVRAYLLGVVDEWFSRYPIAGLRLDAANVMSPGFLAELAEHVHDRWPGAWLVGEIVDGDYRAIAGPGMLDSATNYWAYHSLWTGHREHDYLRVADCLTRQFGSDGQYGGLPLLNFADNHDVDRVATAVGNAASLYPLYGILATMPGVPAIYYGSEWGIPGRLVRGRDRDLRPALADIVPAEPDLAPAISAMLAVRADLPALRAGDCTVLHAAAEQLAFRRSLLGESVTVAVNNSSSWAEIPVDLWGPAFDHLDRAEVDCQQGRVWVPPHWLRILTR